MIQLKHVINDVLKILIKYKNLTLVHNQLIIRNSMKSFSSMIPILMQPMFIDLVGKLYYSNLFCNYNYSNLIHGQP